MTKDDKGSLLEDIVSPDSSRLEPPEDVAKDKILLAEWLRKELAFRKRVNSKGGDA